MSTEEFGYWMVLEAIEPFGERAEYIRAGSIAASIYNVHRDPKKSEPLTWHDIFPWFDKQEEPERVHTWQEIAVQFAAFLEDEGQRGAVFNALEAN
jgi:hypothetical protein